ncbi:unnamed protein product [Pleuronectes platessa]|uniref:Uncharacterized protein n=1 Tax=Pleuronectes platessa TaxID=8262 RepID=A0A9N7VCY3_PLEPL|nr:unnamed protein product [Pleuronectes platessa]
MSSIFIYSLWFEHSPHVLEELCQNKNWEKPVYQLRSATHNPFTPAKLCAAVEEDRVHAAEHTEGAADTSCATAAAVASVAFPGYTLASPASAAVASQLKQTVFFYTPASSYLFIF